ncbi:MAG TPA: diacylglycerol kinase family protein [Bdellovibrionota bacterium]|nr:diacylglycerol kinase family protein [Bdellovibrionota bacterium]
MAKRAGELKKSGIALLVNLRSRKALRDPKFLDHLEEAFGDRGPFVTSRNPSELPSALADVQRTDPEILLVCGGDGTLRQTLTHLLAAYGGKPLPRIAILPAGTMNTVATSLGITGSPLHRLQYLLQRRNQQVPFTVARRHLLEMNRHFGFIFGLGGFAHFIENYSERENPTPFRGFTLLAKTILSALVDGPFSKQMFPDFNASVWRDDQPFLQDATITNVAAASIRHIGFRFKPFFGAEQPDGEFGMLVFRTRPRSLLFHLPRLFTGKPVSDPNLIQLPAKSALVKLNSPQRPMLDGDLLNASKEFQLRSGPSVDFVVA